MTQTGGEPTSEKNTPFFSVQRLLNADLTEAANSLITGRGLPHDSRPGPVLPTGFNKPHVADILIHIFNELNHHHLETTQTPLRVRSPPEGGAGTHACTPVSTAVRIMNIYIYSQL